MTIKNSTDRYSTQWKRSANATTIRISANRITSAPRIPQNSTLCRGSLGTEKYEETTTNSAPDWPSDCP